MTTIAVSLMFSGRCREAFERYAAVLGGEIVFMVSYRDSPAASAVPDEWHDKLWFARLRAGGIEITGSDVLSSDAPQGFSLLVGVETPQEADRIFAGIAVDGDVHMPLQQTHWSSRYGVVRDAFGVRWEINCQTPPDGAVTYIAHRGRERRDDQGSA